MVCDTLQSVSFLLSLTDPLFVDISIWTRAVPYTNCSSFIQKKIIIIFCFVCWKLHISLKKILDKDFGAPGTIFYQWKQQNWSRDLEGETKVFFPSNKIWYTSLKVKVGDGCPLCHLSTFIVSLILGPYGQSVIGVWCLLKYLTHFSLISWRRKKGFVRLDCVPHYNIPPTYLFLFLSCAIFE